MTDIMVPMTDMITRRRLLGQSLAYTPELSPKRFSVVIVHAQPSSLIIRFSQS